MRVNLPVTGRELDYSTEQMLVSVTDTKGFIIHCNRAFVAVSGYTPEELPAFSLPDLTHPDERDALSAQLQCLWVGASNVATFKQRFLHRACSAR